MILLVADFLPFYVCGVAKLALGALHPRPGTALECGNVDWAELGLMRPARLPKRIGDPGGVEGLCAVGAIKGSND